MCDSVKCTNQINQNVFLYILINGVLGFCNLLIKSLNHLIRHSISWWTYKLWKKHLMHFYRHCHCIVVTHNIQVVGLVSLAPPTESVFWTAILNILNYTEVKVLQQAWSEVKCHWYTHFEIQDRISFRTYSSTDQFKQGGTWSHEWLIQLRP